MDQGGGLAPEHASTANQKDSAEAKAQHAEALTRKEAAKTAYHLRWARITAQKAEAMMAAYQEKHDATAALLDQFEQEDRDGGITPLMRETGELLIGVEGEAEGSAS